MRNTVTALLMLAALALPASAVWAKGRPQPMTCPPDVAAALDAACPCAGKTLPNNSSSPWRNHGQYVSCVVHFRNGLRKAGCLSDATRTTIARCAARSTCGKADMVLCCTTTVGTCNDPMPGDGIAAGTCSNDGTLSCDTSADCTQSHAHLAHDDASCTANGGVDVGAGSVCDPCPTTTTTTTSTTTTTLP